MLPVDMGDKFGGWKIVLQKRASIKKKASGLFVPLNSNAGSRFSHSAAAALTLLRGFKEQQFL